MLLVDLSDTAVGSKRSARHDHIDYRAAGKTQLAAINHLAFNTQLILPTFKRGVLRAAISQPNSAGRPAGLAPPAGPAGLAPPQYVTDRLGVWARTSEAE